MKKGKRPAKGYEELDEERTEPSLTMEENHHTARPPTSPEVSPRDDGEHTNPYKLTWRDFNQNFHSRIPSLTDEQKKACLKN